MHEVHEIGVLDLEHDVVADNLQICEVHFGFEVICLVFVKSVSNEQIDDFSEVHALELVMKVSEVVDLNQHGVVNAGKVRYIVKHTKEIDVCA